MVGGLILIWLLLLAESHWIFRSTMGGVLAQLLVLPLIGWPVATGHILLIGLLSIVIIITFRITFGHVLLVGRTIQNFFASSPPKMPLGNVPSPYLGQRPRYSRYVTGVVLAGASQPPVASVLAEDEDEEEIIECHPEFDEDWQEDPLSDINLHKQQIGLSPQNAHIPEPEPLDLTQHKKAVKGARQQPLSFDQPAADSSKKATKRPIAEIEPMEPLAPNPRLLGEKAPVPRLLSSWKVPDASLLNSPDEVRQLILGDDTTTLARTIQDTLRSFRVDAEVRQEDISVGPTIIRLGIRPTGKAETKKDEKTGKVMPVRDAAGNIVYGTRTRVSRIMALQNDLALVLEAKAIRMEAPVPGRPYVGVEIPNKNSRMVTLREVLESKEYQAAKAKSKLTMALGKDVAGQVRIGDMARMPHLLIAGATGAGKSVCINTIIASILTQATPDDVRMLMVDPKMVELNMYSGIPHLLSPVVTEVDKVVPLLKNAINEMERRYRLFSQLGVRNLDGYRKLRLDHLAKGDSTLNNLPAIVIIIDELADLMMAAPEEVEGMICRLAQLARATGIHLVIATQRPSVDVITGLIKANIPTRISFMVSSAVDSRTIIDMGGAERLLGRGDMLYLPADAGRPERIQGAFLADEEAERLVNYWRLQIEERSQMLNDSPASASVPVSVTSEPGWEIKEEPANEFELDDDLLEKAEEVVRESGRASISLLQRRLRIGYSRAARLIDLLEEQGVIGHFEPGGKAREILSGHHEADYGYEDGPSLADEVADIVEEEQARNNFLREQAASRTLQEDQPLSPPPGSNKRGLKWGPGGEAP
ncbi:MAG: DNA translocase FtsK [Chloroflexi bacterium]|nr:MAG: DNA translocase FtsK [Chloroflexota bacterium]